MRSVASGVEGNLDPLMARGASVGFWGGRIKLLGRVEWLVFMIIGPSADVLRRGVCKGRAGGGQAGGPLGPTENFVTLCSTGAPAHPYYPEENILLRFGSPPRILRKL